MEAVRRYSAEITAFAVGLVSLVILASKLDRSYNFDESVNTATVIRSGSFFTGLSGGDSFNNHPVFAAGQAVWWALGGQGEARQRVLPVLYGVLAVALLAWWAARRFGVLAGLCAGLVLALNPMFVTQARLVRGYSLVVLCVVVASIALIEYVRSGRRWLLVPHTVAVIIALGTHLFAGVPLGAVGLAAVAAQRRIDRDLVIAWAAAAVGTVIVYLPSLEKLRDSVDGRGSRYLPWMARTTTWEVLGRDGVTVAVLGAVVMIALVLLLVRTDLRWPAVVLTGLVVGQFVLFWQVIKPFDLYPRFFLATVPLVAIAIAIAVGRIRWLAIAVVGALAFTWSDVNDERSYVLPIREAATVVDIARAAELETCAVGAAPFFMYTTPPPELAVGVPDAAAQLESCDVFLRIASWGTPLIAPAREVYPYEGRVAGVIQVFSMVPLDQLGTQIESR